MRRAFEVTLTTTVTIEVDDKVLAAVDDGWRKQFYNLHTAHEIVGHIAYNMIVNGIELSMMDGFADQLNESARVLTTPDWDVETTEIIKKRNTKREVVG